MVEFKWIEKRDVGPIWWKLTYKGTMISIEKQPWYSDRGNFIAKLSQPGALLIDWVDGWPRYYFSLEVAKSECEAFLRKRDSLGQFEQVNQATMGYPPSSNSSS